eukprot:4734627-Prymnesium_polylepis.1
MGCSGSKADTTTIESGNDAPKAAAKPPAPKPHHAFVEGLFEKSGTPKTLTAGETFIEQNSMSPAAFFIKEGTVELKLSGEKGEQTLATRGAGDILGELSLLLGLPATVTAVATSDVKLVEVQHTQLMGQLREEPAQAGRLFKAIATILAERISELSSIMRSNVVASNGPAKTKEIKMGATDIGKMRGLFGLPKDEKLIGVYKCSVTREINAQREDQPN